MKSIQNNFIMNGINNFLEYLFGEIFYDFHKNVSKKNLLVDSYFISFEGDFSSKSGKSQKKIKIKKKIGKLK